MPRWNVLSFPHGDGLRLMPKWMLQVIVNADDPADLWVPVISEKVAYAALYDGVDLMQRADAPEGRWAPIAWAEQTDPSMREAYQVLRRNLAERQGDVADG